MKKVFILILITFYQSFLFSQEIKEVTLTQLGEGKTKEIAKNNALRNAIEKAFGTFISSNTTILNDELIKDEIVSISSGTIQNYEILNETQLPDGSYSSLVKATVSIGKLTSFCESKGINVEFKGGAFAANIKLQELNKKNELSVVSNLISVLQKISKNIYDYSIKVEDPIKNSISNDYSINILVDACFNNNFNSIKEITTTTLNSIGLSKSEYDFYKKSNLEVSIVYMQDEKTYILRNVKSVNLILSFFGEKNFTKKYLNFKLENGISSYSGEDIMYQYETSIHYRNEKVNFKYIEDRGLFQKTCGNKLVYTLKSGTGQSPPEGIEEFITLDFKKTNKECCTSLYFRNILSLDEIQKVANFSVKPL